MFPRSLVLLLLGALLFSGCTETEEVSTSRIIYGTWKTASINDNISQRVNWRHTDQYGGTESEGQLLNESTSQKFHIWGMCTLGAPVDYIDQHQPGAFDVVLYPGQQLTLTPADEDSANETIHWSFGGCEVAP